MFPFVLARTAGLPFSKLDELRHADVQNEATWLNALAQNFDTLRAWAESPTLQRSLLFASHDLLHTLLEMPETRPAGGWNKKQRKALLAVLRYSSRAIVKTSPFSRLTAVSCARLGAEAPDLPFTLEKHALTPNAGLLPLLYEGLLRTPAFYRNVPVKRGAVWPTESGFRWLFSQSRQESWQEAPRQPALDLVLEQLTEPMLFSRLCNALLDATGEEPEKVESFLLRLADAGLLEWELPETGLTASWAGSLYQKLGFFPADPAIVAVAELLQHWRGAARVLTYQSVSEAMSTQVDLGAHLHAVLTRLQVDSEPIPPEELLYEDVDDGRSPDIPETALRELTDQLRTAWEARGPVPMPPPRARLVDALSPGEHLDLFAFYQRLRSRRAEEPAARLSEPSSGAVGALLQPFVEQGRWRAVVNALYPGGGKLMARWLHLFDQQVLQALVNWQDPDAFAFPWQGWSNANLQAPLCAQHLEVPGGRTRPVDPANCLSLRLEDLSVERRGDALLLRVAPGGPAVRFVDLGLEDPRSRPFVQRLLWMIGTPYVSVSAFWSNQEWASSEAGWAFLPRVESGALVFRRAQWRPSTECIGRIQALRGFDFYRVLGEEAAVSGMPTLLFYRFEQEKPQFLDLDSAVLVEQFRRRLQQHPDVAPVFAEMLPRPEQVPGGRAQEMVVEFRTTKG